MLTVDNKNNIKLTRGDTLSLHISIIDDGEAYEIKPDDEVRFAVARGYKGDKGYELILSEAVCTNTMELTLDSTQTETLSGVYNYDVQITHGSGVVDTFISGKLTIVGEVE